MHINLFLKRVFTSNVVVVERVDTFISTSQLYLLVLTVAKQQLNVSNSNDIEIVDMHDEYNINSYEQIENARPIEPRTDDTLSQRFSTRLNDTICLYVREVTPITRNVIM